MGGFGMRELLILLAIALLLFGAKKLPDLARSFGRSARILKSEAKGLREEDDETSGDRDETGGTGQAQANDQHTGQAHNPSGYPQLPAGSQAADGTSEPRYRRSNA